ncbi:hypothetical protein POM88_017058 [Heracleum sosnowskyi]|uniref:Rapid alkalinization factor n=1 Tax=Heracleum sosnowskyi TaxID=360622 RepID=A0AAD8INF3_9APIA|nr:hypothetical protein POM88_017058 [Heracleum sosnowskyi]
MEIIEKLQKLKMECFGNDRMRAKTQTVLCTSTFEDTKPLSMYYAELEEASRSRKFLGDCMREEEEMMISRRMLSQGSQYISYSALSKDSVPCDYRGHSYYNCGSAGQANPYSRSCSVITQCARA